MLGLLIATTLIQQPTEAEALRAEASIVRTDTGHKLRVVGAECWEVALDRAYKELAPARGGQRFALLEGPGKRLVLARSGRDDLLELSSGAIAPAWADDGRHLLFQDANHGLRVFDASIPSEPAALVSADVIVGSASWAPDAGRILFAKKDGLYSATLEGTAPRRLLKGRTATAIAWHPDGSSIAFAEPGLAGKRGGIRSLRANGADLKTMAEGDALELQWDPSGALLLARDKTGWFVLEPKAGARHVIPPAETGRPTWIGARNLVVPTSGSIQKIEFGAARKDEIYRPIAKDEFAGWLAWALDPEPEISTSMLFGSPFRGAARPQGGQIRAEGVLLSANPITGEFTLLVSATTDSRGVETRLARPFEQSVVFKDGAKQTNGHTTRPLRSIDLKPDDTMLMWLEGDRAAPMQIVQCWIEGADFGYAAPLKAAPRLAGGAAEYDGVSREVVAVPMVFPVTGKVNWSDTFLADRDGGNRRHHGQDLMAAKMTPLVACFDGVVYVGRSSGVGGHNTLRVIGDNGWSGVYYHVNNDTPGTDDGLGTDLYAFAPGLESGQRVFAGQFLGYVGDSGNAENTAPHLHFELWDSVTRAVVNATPSLRAAQRLEEPGAKILQPEMPVRAGEVRMDGIIEEIDPTRKVIRASLLARTAGGKTKAVTTKASVFVVWTEAIEAHILGNDTLPVAFNDLRPGLYVAWVGPSPQAGKAMKPRVGAFAPPDGEKQR